MATVPPGTGVMIMANDQVEVFDNAIERNQTAGVSIVSYLITDKPIQDANYDPFCEAISIHDNRFASNGEKPAGPMGELLAAALGTPLPDILYDGVADPKKLVDGKLPDALAIRIRNNGKAGFANFDAPALKAVRRTRGRRQEAAGAEDRPRPQGVRGRAPRPGTRLDRGAEVSMSPRDRRARSGPLAAWAGLLLLAASGCGARTAPEEAASPIPASTSSGPFEKLSQYQLFEGDPAAQVPAAGVIPYDLNSALFSDYAEKFRFVKLPAGTHATYRDADPFEFPVGTVIAKTFAYPRDARDPSKGRRLIETRILKREPDGWVGLPYVWNAAQTEATLDVAGDTVDVSWIHTDGRGADQQLHHPQRQPVQGLPQVGRGDDADRPEGAAPEPRFRLSRGDGEPARALDPARALAGCAAARPGASTGRLGRPEERHARRPRPRLAGDQLRPLPQPRRPGADHRPRPDGRAAEPGDVRREQAAGGRGHRLGRPDVRHRPRPAG